MFSKIRHKLFFIFSILFAIAAIYHAAALFMKLNDSPMWRNVLFIFINLFCTYGFLKRKKYFILFFFLLMMQQFYSHGSAAIHIWQSQNKLDWMNIAIVIFIPVIFICLIADRKQPEQNKFAQ